MTLDPQKTRGVWDKESCYGFQIATQLHAMPWFPANEFLSRRHRRSCMYRELSMLHTVA